MKKIKDLSYLQIGKPKKLVWNGNYRKKKRKRGLGSGKEGMGVGGDGLRASELGSGL